MFCSSNGFASEQPPPALVPVQRSLELPTMAKCNEGDVQRHTTSKEQVRRLPYTHVKSSLSDGIAIFATNTGALVKHEPQKPGRKRRCFRLVNDEDSPKQCTMCVRIQNALNGTQLDERRVPSNTKIGTVVRDYVDRTAALRVVCNNVLVKLSQKLEAIADHDIVTLALVHEAPVPYPNGDYLLRVFIADEGHRTAVHVSKYDMLLPKVFSRLRRALPHLVRRVASHGAARFARRLASDFPPAVQRRRLLDYAHRRFYVYAGESFYEELDVVDVILAQGATGHLTLRTNWQGWKVDKPTKSASRAMHRFARSRQL